MADDAIVDQIRIGTQLLQAGHLANAESVFAAVLRVQPDNARANHFLGVAAMQRSDYTSAERLMERAIITAPNVPEFHHNLAAVYRAVGKIDLAARSYQRSIALKPDYYEAYFNWSNVSRYSDNELDPASIEELLLRNHLNSRDRSFLHFAAGKGYANAKQFDKAFSHYRLGNRAQESRPYPLDVQVEAFEHIRSVFSESRCQISQLGSDPDCTRVIFIVGMPRSGTTLTEQIISRHPNVHGAGELQFLSQEIKRIEQQTGRRFPECLEHLSVETLRRIRTCYLSRVQSLSSKHRIFVDKMPSNFMHIGLISILFPEAKIIHCQRDPLDTCLSCFFTRFAIGHEYTTSLTNLGLYYRLYVDLMRHWQMASSIEVFDWKYENLVRDPERSIRSLAEYCQISWDDRILDSQPNSRPIETASSCQVREGIHDRSIHRWKDYDIHLTPLKFALGL